MCGPFGRAVTPVMSLRQTRCDREPPTFAPRRLSHPGRTVGPVSAAVAAFEFLRSPSGRAMVVRALERRGLPLALRDDLVSEVLRRVVTAEHRGPIDNPPG